VLLCGPRGGLEGVVDGVRLRRGGEIDGRLGQRQLAFGRAKVVVCILRGVGDDQRLRVGKPDVLGSTLPRS
jgi:hypothetical protein